LKGKQFHLVTADGGVDCSADPEFQEQNSADLKAAEYKGICYKLKPKGNALLKLFCCCHESTLKILESAASSFRKVELVKPASSKAGNSELYLVMLGYFGRMAPLENTVGFLETNLNTIRYFSNRQRKAIADNLEFKNCQKDWNINMSSFVQSYKEIILQKIIRHQLKEHPWSKLNFKTTIFDGRRRQGNLNERKNRELLSLKELERDLKGMKKENLPKIRRFSAKRMRMQSLEIIKSPKRLNKITNSLTVSDHWMSWYSALIKYRPELFNKAQLISDECPYPQNIKRLIEDPLTLNLARENTSMLKDSSVKMVHVKVQGSAGVPWPELIIRNHFISDIREAVRLLDKNGHLILEISHTTFASRLSSHLLILLFNTFDSVEPIVPAQGYVFYIMRRMVSKESGMNNVARWFPTIHRELESEEVLQLFPIGMIAKDQNLLRHLRRVNDWLIQCTCLALLDEKEQEIQIPERDGRKAYSQ
jgi:hypothetical protein